MTPPQFPAAADAVVSESRARIRTLADRLRAGDMELDEWYREMKHQTKMLHMANAALARGGWDKMRDEDWQRVEETVAAQWNGVGQPPYHGKGEFPGLRAFAEDLKSGRYGGIDDLRESFLNRANNYAEAGRATYENEQLRARMEQGHGEARAIPADVEHCPDCLARARLGWIPILEMIERYPIGRSACNVYCYCTIVTRIAPELEADNDVASMLTGGALPSPEQPGQHFGGSVKQAEDLLQKAGFKNVDLYGLRDDVASEVTLALARAKKQIPGLDIDAIEIIIAPEEADGILLMNFHADVAGKLPDDPIGKVLRINAEFFNQDLSLEKVNATIFPERIPSDIFLNIVSHRQPYPGDHGIQFEPVETTKTGESPQEI